MLAGLFMIAFVLGMYFVPTLVACGRGHRQAGAITVLNIFLGWTVIGWVGALVWACTNPAPPPTVIHQVIQSPAAIPAQAGTAAPSAET